jgi:translation elongation factor EF-4
VIPVLNKIDLQSAQVERSVAQMHSLFDVEPEDVIKVSGMSSFC